MHKLKTLLNRIDQTPYNVYQGLKGPYDFENYLLKFNQVQADPFAEPSKITVSIPMKKAGFPENLFETPEKSKAFRDALARIVQKNIRKFASLHRGTGNGGLFAVSSGFQKILNRNTVSLGGGNLTLRMLTGLPAHGRKIAGGQAISMFFEELSEIVRHSLFWKKTDKAMINSFVNLVEKQEMLRAQLFEKKILCFIADGAILPRSSGVKDTPLNGAVPFSSPEDLRVTLDLPRGEKISGMGIPAGVTLITGGGFHGKSTLMNAISHGIYNHVPGDGREFVISRRNLVKVRAEDGRFIEKTDISTFINHLPMGKNTREFQSENASGSTSQAANIAESLEAGAGILLMDEDTSATNFLIRDERMQALIPDEKEPITPFLDVVRPLFEQKSVSTIFAVGGSGDYIDVADTVLLMDEYTCKNATKLAKKIAAEKPITSLRELIGEIRIPARVVDPTSIDFSKGKRTHLIRGDEKSLSFGRENIDLSAWEHLTERAQSETLGNLIAYAKKSGILDGTKSVSEVLSAVFSDVEQKGWDILFQSLSKSWFYTAEVRPVDVAAALSRLRTLKVK